MPTVPPAAASPIAPRATQGLQSMQKAYDSHKARVAGDEALLGIASDAAAAPDEKAIAQALQAAAQKVHTDYSATNAQRVALQALSTGVSGPLTHALAHAALACMDKAYSGDDSRVLGSVLLDVIARNAAAPAEKILAETARDASSQQISAYTATNVQRIALANIEIGPGDDVTAALAASGPVFMDKSYSSDEERAMGRAALTAIATHAGPGTASQFAAAAASVANQGTAYTANNAERIAFAHLQRPITQDLPTLLVAFATEAMPKAYSTQDRHLVATATLQTMAPQAGPLADLLQATREVSKGVTANTASSMDDILLARVAQGPVSGMPEAELAQVAQQTMGKAYSSADASTLGQAVVRRFEGSADLRIQGLSAFAKGIGSEPFATLVQKKVLESVAEMHPMTPDGDVAKRAQDQILAVERDTVEQMERAIHTHEASLAQWDAKVQELEAKAQTFQLQDGSLLERFEKARRVAFGSVLGTGIGMVTAVATHSPIALAVAGVSGIVFMGAMTTYLLLHGKVMTNGGEGRSTRMELEMYRLIAESEKMRLQLMQGEYEKVHATVRELDAKLAVTRMADAITAAPDPNARVSVEDDAVTIGSVRIPRNNS